MTVTRRQSLGIIGGAIAAATVGNPVKARTLRPSLLRGFNLPDLVPQKYNTRINPDQLRTLHRLGMRHIRLPVVGENFMPRFAGRATIDYTLDVLDRVLDDLLKLNFAVTVDMHPAEEFPRLLEKSAVEGEAALISAWKNIASRLRKRDPALVFAELLNEPSTTDKIWRPQAERLAKILRQDLPETMFITGPAPFQRVEALAGWEPLPDRNITYAFHYYDPMAFSHQGQTWFKDDPLSRLAGFPFPASKNHPRVKAILANVRKRGDKALLTALDEALMKPWTSARVRKQFAELEAWRDKHKVPVILNEFGALRFQSPRADRLRWIETVRLASEESGFGWAHWDYSGGFGLVAKTGRIDKGVVKALTGRNLTG